MDEATGEAEGTGLRVAFDRRLKLEFHGATVTSDAGLLAFRELDDALGLTAMAAEVLADPRTGRNGRHSLIAQLRQSVFGRLAGYEDVNDADRLGRDPAMRWIVGGRAVTEQAASTSQMGRFETSAMTVADEPDGAGRSLGALDRPRASSACPDDAGARHRQQREPDLRRAGGHGLQRPLRVHLLPSALRVQPGRRPGAVRAAAGQRPQRARLARRARPGGRAVSRPGRSGRLLRGDAAFALPGRVRVPGGGGLPVRDSPARQSGAPGADRAAAHAAGGTAPHYVRRFYASFRYRAQSWSRPRRVVAKVEWHPGELYPRVGFIVTNLRRPAKKVVAFYNGRGTAEQWIKEGKHAVKWTRLSCTTFRANAVRLQLHALAYNLANFLRTLALPGEIERWSLTSLREKVVKIGAKVIAHGRYAIFQMAEVAVPRELFGRILDRIARLRPPDPAPC